MQYNHHHRTDYSRQGYISNQYHRHGGTPMNQPRGGCDPCGQRSSMPVVVEPRGGGGYYGGQGGGYYNHGQIGATTATVVAAEPKSSRRDRKKKQEYDIEEYFDTDTGREWTTGICGCFEDAKVCLAGFFCGGCFICYLSKKIDENMCGVLCFGYPWVAAMRSRVRTILGIEGSMCGDQFAALCCGPCSTTQMYRELKNLNMID